MGFDFPASPSVGASFNPGVGKPTYIWDGEKWGVTPPTAAQQRAMIYAAPFDAMSYNGLLINSAMEVNQEGIVGQTAHASPICDGWVNWKAGTLATIARCGSTNPGSFTGSSGWIGIECTTAQASLGSADGAGLFQAVEGYRVARLALGTPQCLPMTLAFWSSHVRTGIYSGVIRSTATGYAYVFEYYQAASNVAQWNVISIPPLTVGGNPNVITSTALHVLFAMAAGAGIRAAPNAWLSGSSSLIGSNNQINGVAATTDRFNIGNAMLLPGVDAPSAATAHAALRPYNEELRLCQRYINAGFISGAALTSSSMTNRNQAFWVPFPESMRASPTGSLSNITTNRCTLNGIGWSNAQGFNFLILNTVSGGDDLSFSFNWAMQARLL